MTKAAPPAVCLVVCLVGSAAAGQFKDGNREGLVTFREHGFQFRVPPNQIAQVVALPNGQTLVELSVDRREFGALAPPGKLRISCSNGSCTDLCADGPPCPDLNAGWYRVTVIPAPLPRGADPHPLNRGPQPGTGYRCVEAGHGGLELCWDPRRVTPDVSSTREVAYPALRDAAAYTWISRSFDAGGHPNFVASCAGTMCIRNIERRGARLQVTFHVQELDDWQRFDAGLRSFAERLWA
jgi:hypothetical protein